MTEPKETADINESDREKKEIMLNSASTLDEIRINDGDKTSFWFTFMTLMRMTVGIGILTLPRAAQKAGMIGGVFIILAVGVLLMYNMIILSNSNRLLMFKTKEDLGLSETIEVAVRYYTGTKASKYIRHFFNGFIVIYLLGACSVYFRSSFEIMMDIFPEEDKNAKLISLSCLLSTMPLTFIPKAIVLSIISMISNILCVFGLIVVFINCFMKLRTPAQIRYGPNSAWGFFEAINKVIFTFEVMSSLIPVLNTLDRPKKIPTLVYLSNSFTIILYVFMAVVGYLAYGDELTTLIIKTLPKNHFNNVVRGLFSMGLILSFSVFTYCIITIIMPFLNKRITFKIQYIPEFITRAIFVATAILIGVYFDSLDAFLDILGAFFALPISFVIPPLVNLLTTFQFEENALKKRNIVIINSILLVFGVIFNLIGIVTSVKLTIEEKFKK